MKKLATLCTVLVLCTGYAISADNDKEEGKGKKTPPGLEKKGGVPPGQAKKQNKAGESAPESTPAATPAPAATATPVATPTPAAATVPATAPATVKPATIEPAKTPSTPTALKADPKTATAKPATLAEQKAALEGNTRTINQAIKANPAQEKVALQQISKETGVSLDELKQQEKYHPNVGPNSLLIGNLIAKKSGKRFGELLRIHQGGKPWTDIAKAHNVEIDPLVQKSSRLAQTLHSAGAK